VKNTARMRYFPQTLGFNGGRKRPLFNPIAE
jgi:hypothetical protein